MKRFLALAALLFICVGPVTADYLFIKIDLNKVHSASEDTNQPGQQPGFGPMGGMPPGLGLGGAAGKPGGKGGGFQPGLGPQPGGGINPGGAGGQAPPMGAGGPMGAVGPMGMVGPGGFGNAEPEEPPHWIMASIELYTKPQIMRQRGSSLVVTEVEHHSIGHHGRFPMLPGIVDYLPVPHLPVTKQFSRSYGKYVRDANDAAALYRAASWALEHGLKKEFHNTMAILAKVDAKHFAVVNYQRLQTELSKAPAADDPATREIVGILKDEGMQLTVSDEGHYGMLAKVASPLTAAMVKRRLVRLEQTLEGFYYWLALQEHVSQPGMPPYRLYAIMVDDKERFHRYHAEWSKQPMVANGFTPRRDNLIFLAAKRFDEDSVLFDKSIQTLVAKLRLSREELISGRVWDKAANKANLFPVSAVQTLAIMQKAMEDEAEKAAISHEATRQLLFATGMLPRLVNVPEWVQSGMGSFFDTPRGALFRGIGLPNWNQLVAFKHYVKNRKIGGNEDDRYETFLRTISNRYFIDAVRAADDARDKTDREDIDGKLKQNREIAHCTAWSLVYYLLALDRKLPQWLEFTRQLNELPRDMELDETTLQLCFGRAFGLIDPANSRRLDANKTRIFANTWFSRIGEVNLEVTRAEQLLEEYRYPAPAKKKATNQQYGPGQGGPQFGPGQGANPNLGPMPGLNANPAAIGGKGGKGPRGG